MTSAEEVIPESDVLTAADAATVSLLAADALSVTADAVDCFCFVPFKISAFTGSESVIAETSSRETSF